MNCKHIGLVFALMLSTPALASVNTAHEPSRDRSPSSTLVAYEKVLEVISHNEERSLPLECRGYNISEKARREFATRSLNRCE